MNEKKSPLSDLKVPDVTPESHKRQLKLTLFDARKSAALAVWLVAVPCFFLFAVFMKHYFMIDLHIFTIIEESIASIDKTIPMLSPILLVGFPLIAVLINALAILHVSIDRERREVILHVSIDRERREVIATVKVRWINLACILLGLTLIGIFISYVIIENIHHYLLKTL
ncbi:MAG: hypothetical protein HW407_580 [Bacteroidetes bacterium]|nr:hypothetical protein [Bacteroidota bacterium]